VGFLAHVFYSPHPEELLVVRMVVKDDTVKRRSKQYTTKIAVSMQQPVIQFVAVL